MIGRCGVDLGAGSLSTQRELADRVVRLHVLANSDSEEDQALKLTVRDRILEVAEPVLEVSADREEARAALEAALPQLEQTAEETIAAAGYDYAVTASLEETEFPTREYDGFSLPAGEYLALRVVIGAGEAELVVRGVSAPVRRGVGGCAGGGRGGGSSETRCPSSRRPTRLCAEIQGGGAVERSAAEEG